VGELEQHPPADVGDDEIERAVDLGQRGRGGLHPVADAVVSGVDARGRHRLVGHVDGEDLGGAQQGGHHRQDAAPAADVEDPVALGHQRLHLRHRQAGRLVRPGSEGATGVEDHHQLVGRRRPRPRQPRRVEHDPTAGPDRPRPRPPHVEVAVVVNVDDDR
jgi:hypothetical protein